MFRSFVPKAGGCSFVQYGVLHTSCGHHEMLFSQRSFWFLRMFYGVFFVCKIWVRVFSNVTHQINNDGTGSCLIYELTRSSLKCEILSLLKLIRWAKKCGIRNAGFLRKIEVYDIENVYGFEEILCYLTKIYV